MRLCPRVLHVFYSDHTQAEHPLNAMQSKTQKTLVVKDHCTAKVKQMTQFSMEPIPPHISEHCPVASWFTRELPVWYGTGYAANNRF